MRSRGPRRRDTAPVDRYNAALLDTVPHASTTGQQVCWFRVRLIHLIPDSIYRRHNPYTITKREVLDANSGLSPIPHISTGRISAYFRRGIGISASDQGQIKPGSNLRKYRTRNQESSEKHRGRNTENRTGDRRHIQETDGNRCGKRPGQSTYSEIEQAQEVRVGCAGRPLS